MANKTSSRIISLLLGTAVATAASLFNLLIISRILEGELIGVFFLLQSIYLTTELISNAQLGYILPRELSERKGHGAIIGSIATMEITLYFIIFLVVILLSTNVPMIIGGHSIGEFLPIVFLPYVWRAIGTCQGLARFNKNEKLVAQYSAGLALSRSALLLIFAQDLNSVLIIYAVSEMALNTYLFFATRLQAYLFRSNPLAAISLFIQGAKLNLATLVTAPMYAADVIVLSNILPLEVLGQYKLIRRSVGILGKLLNPVAQVAYIELLDAKSYLYSFSRKKIFLLSAMGELVIIGIGCVALVFVSITSAGGIIFNLVYNFHFSNWMSVVVIFELILATQVIFTTLLIAQKLDKFEIFASVVFLIAATCSYAAIYLSNVSEPAIVLTSIFLLPAILNSFFRKSVLWKQGWLTIK